METEMVVFIAIMCTTIGIILAVIYHFVYIHKYEQQLLKRAEEEGLVIVGGKLINVLRAGDYLVMKTQSQMFESIRDERIRIMRTKLDREELVEEAGNPDILFADGFDDALIGYIEIAGGNTVALYDYGICIEKLIHRDGMSEEEAVDFFYYNVVGSYVGEHTPAFATLLKERSLY